MTKTMSIGLAHWRNIKDWKEISTRIGQQKTRPMNHYLKKKVTLLETWPVVFTYDDKQVVNKSGDSEQLEMAVRNVHKTYQSESNIAPKLSNHVKAKTQVDKEVSKLTFLITTPCNFLHILVNVTKRLIWQSVTGWTAWNKCTYYM